MAKNSVIKISVDNGSSYHIFPTIDIGYDMGFGLMDVTENGVPDDHDRVEVISRSGTVVLSGQRPLAGHDHKAIFDTVMTKLTATGYLNTLKFYYKYYEDGLNADGTDKNPMYTGMLVPQAYNFNSPSSGERPYSISFKGTGSQSSDYT